EVYFIISAAIEHRRPAYFLDILCLKNCDGYAVLHRALILGNVEIVRKILSTLESDNDLRKSNLKANSPRHLSCLHLAIQSQNPELIKEMINYLSKDEHLLLNNLISQSSAGFTILQECVKNSPSVAAVEQLLSTLLEPRN